MNTATPFIVLIERQRTRRLVGLLLMAALLLGLLAGHGAHAQTTLSPKIAADLAGAINAPSTPKISFAKDVNGIRYVKALVVSQAGDPDLVALRAAVMSAGGSVYMRYVSVAALSVMLPASQVNSLAARADVQSISPNRLTARTASLLEMSTGVTNVRTGAGPYTGLDGTGVGIAVLDSGVLEHHGNLLAADGKTLRVKRAVDFQRVGDATLVGAKDWTPGIDASASLYPGSSTMAAYETKIDYLAINRPDLYGHGTHVASVAAGRGAYQAIDSTGIAPNASVFDVRVLDGSGMGQVSDVLAGIDWVIYHAKEYKIRVMNLSLAADSTESYLTDPLCRAVRSATAAGITVVVAAGNFGQTATGAERFGTISSPGNEPSVITVGAANTKGSAARGDDSVNFFSSRSPSRSAFVDTAGVRRVDNLLKPDLVAPGNKIVGALATDKAGAGGSWNYLGASYTALSAPYGGARQPGSQALMNLSGTSIAAPAVAGTVALMLQANPGLTPPLIKAMLQYSAQPIADANLLQQGAGLLNVDGAVRLAQALRTDLASAIGAGTLQPGASMLAAGRVLPAAVSTINGTPFGWSGMVYAGGNQILSGAALFSSYQPIWDPRLSWVRGTARRASVSYWPAATGVPASTFVKSIVEAPAANQGFVTAGVVSATALVGSSSWLGKTGAFLPTVTLAGWLAAGSGLPLGQGILLSTGVVLSEGLVLSESGQTAVPNPNDSSLLGEP